MGLLDDAIREHLDLKRRRGADPTEVERAEREALGPVRRGPEGPLDGELGLQALEEADFAYDHEAEHPSDWTHDSLEEPAGEARGAPAEPEFASELEDDQFLGAEFDPEPGIADPEHHATPPPPHPAGGQETAEYDLADAIRSEDEAGTTDDDVLEETPEFLQDTPDHDRLWFEQRPPKDFDFDG